MMTKRILVLSQRYFALAVALVFLSVSLMAFSLVPLNAKASERNVEIKGVVYEFDKDTPYTFTSETPVGVVSDETNTYGLFNIAGDIVKDTSKDGVRAFTVKDETSLSFTYSYTDNLLLASEDEWHLIDDKTKKVDTLTLEDNILKGAVIVQTSMNGDIWHNASVRTNVFANTPNESDAFFQSENVQLVNGCYYRVIVAYELERKTGTSNILFVSRDVKEYKRVVEVYTLFACNEAGEESIIDPQNVETRNVGTLIKTGENGYVGEEEIGINDVHYGWELGNFFISGHTASVGTEGAPVFLKNVGDRVTLWFNLRQDIDTLNNKSNLSIAEDTDGYDSYFQTDRGNFGRGTLIIRHKDYQGATHKPIIYTNYLEANTSFGANTRVQLFEEGDYEVRLDYEVRDKGRVWSDYTHYRIEFSFSVRNGNSMFFIFDSETGEELLNNAITENGFRLDLARSRYLDINIRKEILQEGATGLVEDTRFNRPARDGEIYTDDGIYTIRARTQYSDEPTVKTIYVGTNGVLKAYVATSLSIEQIQALLALGATIEEDGSITMPPTSSEPDVPANEPEEEETEEATDASEEGSPKVEQVPNSSETGVSSEAEGDEGVGDNANGTNVYMPVIIACVAVALCGTVALNASKRKKEKALRDEQDTKKQEESSPQTEQDKRDMSEMTNYESESKQNEEISPGTTLEEGEDSKEDKS